MNSLTNEFKLRSKVENVEKLVNQAAACYLFLCYIYSFFPRNVERWQTTAAIKTQSMQQQKTVQMGKHDNYVKHTNGIKRSSEKYDTTNLTCI